MNENKNPMSIDPWHGSLSPLQSPAINRRSLIALGGLIGLEMAGCGGGGGGGGGGTVSTLAGIVSTLADRKSTRLNSSH